MDEKTMNKLQRYDESITLCCKKCGAVFPATEKHRCFGPDEKSEEIFELKHFNEKLEIALVDKNTDVCALEAENERLREVLKNLLQDTQHSNHHCKDTIENCPVLAAKAILNREQEKQP